MTTPKNRWYSPRLVALALGAALIPPVAHATTINLNASDAVGTTSFNAAGHWSNGQAPSAANDYNTAGFFMRTPGDGNTNYVFAGASLTLGNQNTSGGNNGSLLEKYSGGAGAVRWLTINNLTNSTGALLRSGGTAGALIHIQGNIFNIAGISAINADQCIWVIDSPLVGSDNMILTNFANNANDHVAYTGTNSGYTGSWYLTGGGTSSWSLELDNVNSLPGNPSSFNAGQITFFNLGQLRDTVGCSLTNSNSGITLAGNGTINTTAATLIGEPITDVTNGVHSLSSLTVASAATGTLILSNANNNYSGGTVVSAGATLQYGVDNAIPGNTVNGDVTATGTLDMNGHNATINGLNGAGTVDTTVGGPVTLTLGANGDGGTFTGTIQNTAGPLSIVKVGAGTQTFSGASLYTGTTTIAAGVLNFSSANGVSPSPGNLIVSNGASFGGNASSGTPVAVNNLMMGTNSTLNLTLDGTTAGLNVAGNLTFQENVTNNFSYGTLAANPTAPAINVSGSLSAPGTNVVITITALGLKAGTFTLIKYSGAALPSLSNFQLSLPLGFAATLINNTGNRSIDVNITIVPDNVAWNGGANGNWDTTSINWQLIDNPGNYVAFRQGDVVTFDDTLTNDLVDPQPTNVNLTTTFSVYPIPGLVVNSSLPYTLYGPGGITGATSLIKSNIGTLTLLTSNSFTGGVSINDSGSLIITNDNNLGASSGNITINGGTLEMIGAVTNSRAISVPVTSSIGVATNVTSTLGGVISGAAATLNKIDNGTLVLTGKETITGNVFVHSGTLVIDSGGSITNGSYHDVGQNGNDTATMTLRGTGSFGTTSDFNVGDIENSSGILNIQNSSTLVVNAFFVGSANTVSSTASGVVNQSGGTLTEVSTGVGTFDIGGRTSTFGVGVYNISGGTINANAGIRVGSTGVGTLNQSGGTINAKAGINIARIAGSFGTNNLNGGLLATFNVASSTGSNAVFNFNGGTLQAQFSPSSATWFSGGIQANVLAGGAIIDTSTNNATVSVGLLGTPGDGGLTKKGSGTLTLTGTNTVTGPITNTAGTLFLNSPSTYSGAVINAGALQLSTASIITGNTFVNSNAVLGVSQVGSGTLSLGNLTFQGTATGSGATIALTPTTANNPAVPMVNCGTVTLNGTNSISLAAVNVGTVAVLKYTPPLGGAGSGNITNLILPQGATGTISNDVADSILYAVITSTGPGLIWTGTNTSALNTWNIGITTNWTVNGTPTSYHQIITPGDSVTFNDSGSGTVILNTNVAPASLTVSNNSKIYTFSGSGNISGSTGLQKIGGNTAILTLSNNFYQGDTVISNGTLQIGTASTLSPNANVVVGPTGTLELAGFSQTIPELRGSGVVDNNSGLDLVMTEGTSAGGTWAGSITDHGGGAIALTKTGSGTWVVAGTNRFANGTAFTVTNQFNGGTTILTNGGVISSPFLETVIANAGSTARMIVDGGTLAVSNNVLAIGNAAGATGTMIVNNGTVFHGGAAGAAFGAANNIVVGAGGSTGTLTVNGGQVLNTQALTLADTSTGVGTLNLNGGLVQATAVTTANAAASTANFNGGTIQAVTNSGDFLQVTSLIWSNGLTIDDGGWAVSIFSQQLQPGDNFNGGLTKTGAGTVYMDSGAIYIGNTKVINGTLAGSGSVAGTVTVMPGGNIGAGDAGSPGTFTIASNLTLQGSAMMRINRDTLGSDIIMDLTKVTYGGTLVISNLSSTPMQVNDTFQLFNTPSHTGNFSNIAGSPGAGLAYSFNPVNGYVTVVTSTIATNPTNITFTVSGGNLTMTWPSDHAGWTLQSNSVDLATPGNWFDYPSATGSRDTTQVTIPLSGVSSNTFFRLKYP